MALSVLSREAAAAISEVHYAVSDTRFGPAFAVCNCQGDVIYQLGFPEANSHSALTTALEADWQAARAVRDDALIDRLPWPGARVCESLDGGSLQPVGTLFQGLVWRALSAVPAGAQLSYRELAAMAGRPSAVRAVASAVARNPIAWLMPCHRIVRADGQSGGYRWGAGRKRAMLAWEREQL